MTATCSDCSAWADFLEYAQERCSATAFQNWLVPIRVVEWDEEEVVLEVPNIFVQEYLLENYRQDLCAFLPLRAAGEPALRFLIASSREVDEKLEESRETSSAPSKTPTIRRPQPKLNSNYRFETYIEGPSNQFVKSAALGVAERPGEVYNPLFIHGGVGLGKTHLLHSIGHHVLDTHRHLVVESVTTEGLINSLVDSLRAKSISEWKRRLRSVDLLLIDDIQFLEPRRANFEEEFINTVEALIHQGRQVVITSDKPPGQLKLSERMVARMEWGLVVSVNMPDLETRVAILMHKAEQKGINIPSRVALFIAEHIYSNVRQLEGAINRLSAHSRLLNQEIDEELVQRTLHESFQRMPAERISVDQILKSVAAFFGVTVRELRGTKRTENIVLPRQIAMYLATEMVNESLTMLGASFGGKTHTTVVHARDKIRARIESDETFRRKINMVRNNIAPAA